MSEELFPETLKLGKIHRDLNFYYSPRCPYTKKSIPEINCLENYLKTKDPEYYQLNKKNTEIYNGELTSIQSWREKCGGVPYYYNTKTGQGICGYVPCEILRRWADNEI